MTVDHVGCVSRRPAAGPKDQASGTEAANALVNIRSSPGSTEEAQSYHVCRYVQQNGYSSFTNQASSVRLLYSGRGPGY